MAGINGGFFSYGNVARWSLKWAVGKFKSKVLGTGRSAFPSAILKIGDHLISDTSSSGIPAIGWNKDGSKTVIGELKVQWFVRLHDPERELKLHRETELNHDIREKYIYVPSKRYEIKDHEIIEVESVDEVDKELLNSFTLDRSEYVFEELSVGDKLEIHYQWDSRRMSSVDPQGFSGLDYVLSGGAILMQNGEVQDSFSEMNYPSTSSPRTGICLHKDGSWKMIVSPTGYLLLDFANFMKERGCHDAINLDGGGSPTMYFPHEKKMIGSDIMVSDAIALMPREQWGLRSYLSRGEKNIFDLLKADDKDAIKGYLDKNSLALKERNINRQTPLQALLAVDPARVDAALITLFIEKMDLEDLFNRDVYGESAALTAVRNGHFNVATQIVSKGGLENCSQKGVGDQTLCGVIATMEDHPELRSILGDCLDALVKGMRDFDSDAGSDALDLFQALVEKGQAYEKAADAAAEGMSNPESLVRWNAQKLFQALVVKGQAYEKAADAAAKGMSDSTFSARLDALKLFQALVEKGQAYEKAADAAAKGMSDRDFTVEREARQLKSMLKPWWIRWWPF
ncbi:MAG: phosphodiester glycosidase family protein [Deltaproteobacteria bacterium]|nr:phosphodiester glycosidase family protein [Deltaproteobacteria bacterium]